MFALHLAAYKSLVNQERGNLKTHTLHSEVVFMLSGSKHIAEAYRVFGPSEGCADLIAAVFDADADALQSVQDVVQGQVAPLDALAAVSDATAVRKAYAVTAAELGVTPLAGVAAARMGNMETQGGKAAAAT